MYSDLPMPATHPAEIAQLLDEHHLVVLSRHATARSEFAVTLSEQLEALPDTEVVPLDGSGITDLQTFCRELWEHLPGRLPRDGRSVDDVIKALRGCPPHLKHQFFLWSDAHVLLEADPGLFGRLANAFLGVAAEHEHVNPDMLVLQRIVFLGDEGLSRYAGDSRGQLRSWLLEDDTSPFWEVVSCVAHPPVLTYRLD